MLGVIIVAAAGIWTFVFVLVLALCAQAKAGDEAMGISSGGVSARGSEGVVLELVVNQRDPDVRKLPRLA